MTADCKPAARALAYQIEEIVAVIMLGKFTDPLKRRTPHQHRRLRHRRLRREKGDLVAMSGRANAELPDMAKNHIEFGPLL